MQHLNVAFSHAEKLLMIGGVERNPESTADEVSLDKGSSRLQFRAGPAPPVVLKHYGATLCLFSVFMLLIKRAIHCCADLQCLPFTDCTSLAGSVSEYRPSAADLPGTEEGRVGKMERDLISRSHHSSGTVGRPVPRGLVRGLGYIPHRGFG
jgi:hypothetical protein